MLNTDINFFKLKSHIRNTSIKELNRKGCVSSEVSYDTLLERAELIAQEFLKLGLQNRRILLVMHNGIEFVEVIAACLIARCTAVPVSLPRTKAQSDRLKSIIEDAEIEVALTNSGNIFEMLNGTFQGSVVTLEMLKSGQASIPSYRYDECSNAAFIQYTSGSTSDPKGVVVSIDSLIANVDLIAKNLDSEEGEVFVSWLPMFHDMGLVGFVYQCLRYRSDLILFDPLTFIQKPVRWLKAISDHKATITAGPNFAFEAVVNRVDESELQGIDLSSMRSMLNGSEPVLPSTLTRFSEKLTPYGLKDTAIMPCYGLAEATLMVTSKPVDTAYITEINPECEFGTEVVSSGTVNDAVNVEIIDTQSQNTLANRCVGEVVISGDSVFEGYLGKEPYSPEYWLESAGQQYYRTGDLGFVSNNNLFITGRKKDLVIIRGRNIYPSDVEACVEPLIHNKKPHSVVAFSHHADGADHLVVMVELEQPVVAAAFSQTLIQKITRVIVDQIHVEPRVVLCKPHTILKTSSGKLKRNSCRDIYIQNDRASFACELKEELE